MIRKIALAIVLAGIAGVASAGECGKPRIFDFFSERKCEPRHIKVVAAPEIDPASAIGGLTLLLGGLVVLRGRSKSLEV